MPYSSTEHQDTTSFQHTSIVDSIRMRLWVLFQPGASYPRFTAGRLTLHMSCINSCYVRGQGEIKSTSIMNRSFLNLLNEWKSKPVVNSVVKFFPEHSWWMCFTSSSGKATRNLSSILQGFIGNWSVCEWLESSPIAPCFPSLWFLAFENRSCHTGQIRHSAHRHAPGSSVVALALAAALRLPLRARTRRSLSGSSLAIPHREAGPHAGGSHNTNQFGCINAGPNQNGSHNLNQFGCYELTQCATCQRIFCSCSRSVTSQMKYESSLP